MWLIDADKLKKEVASTFHGTFGLTVTSAVHEIIDRQPTIDPESLRPHGEWIVLQIDNYSNCAIFGCSQCKTAAGIITRPTWRFCPHCGAKMEDTNEN